MTTDERNILDRLLGGDDDVPGWRSALAAALHDFDASERDHGRCRECLEQAITRGNRLADERDRARAALREGSEDLKAARSGIARLCVALVPVTDQLHAWRAENLEGRAFLALSPAEADAILAVTGGTTP